MSTVISEGFATETTRIFEPPQVNQDNARTRYLTTVASFITPTVSAQRPWTKGGGVEIANPCLRYVRNFLRKGRITPLLRDTHDFLPYDLVKKTLDVDPLDAGYFAQQIPVGYEPPRLPPPNGQGALMGGTGLGGFSSYGTMVGKLALPGQQISAIVDGDDNVCRNHGRKGIVELDLAGHEYRTRPITMDSGAVVDYDPELWKIQRALFPNYPDVPVKLDDVENLLDRAWETHESLRPIIEQYQQSASQARAYFDIYIQNVNQQMRERAPNGYVRPYTEGDLVILDQLGMERQDRAAIRQATSDNRTEELFQQFMELQVEEKKANLERQKRLDSIGQGGASTVTPEVLTNATPLAQEQIADAMIDTEAPTFTCEACGETMKLSAKGFHIGRHCKVLNAKPENPESEA